MRSTSAAGALRAELAELLDTLGLRRPVDAHELCRRLGSHLGRPVHVRGRALPTAHATGAVFRIGEPSEAYVIAYQAATAAGHQAHVIFHEVMHIIRGHLDRAAADGPLISCRGIGEPDSPKPAESPGDAGELAMEWEAEAGATILTEWSRTDSRRRAQTGGDPAALRFASALMGAPWT